MGMYEGVDFDLIRSIVAEAGERKQKMLRELMEKHHPLVMPLKSGYCLCAYRWIENPSRIVTGLLEFRKEDGFYLGSIKLLRGVNVDYIEVLDANGCNDLNTNEH